MNPFESDLDAALRQAPEVEAPRNFHQRLMTQLPEAPPSERSRSWQLPLLMALAAIVFSVLMVVALDFGLTRWLTRPPLLLTVLAIETAIALAWLWRTVFSR